MVTGAPQVSHLNEKVIDCKPTMPIFGKIVGPERVKRSIPTMIIGQVFSLTITILDISFYSQNSSNEHISL